MLEQLYERILSSVCQVVGVDNKIHFFDDKLNSIEMEDFGTVNQTLICLGDIIYQHCLG